MTLRNPTPRVAAYVQGDAEKLAVSVDTPEQRRGLAVRQINTKLAVTATLFVVILALLALFAPSFFRRNNLINVLVQTSSLGLMAIGMAPVMIAGERRSIPANMALAAVFGALFMEAGGNPVVGSLIMLASGTLVGLLNGVAVAVLGIISFVVTLATMTVTTGAAVWPLTRSASPGSPTATRCAAGAHWRRANFGLRADRGSGPRRRRHECSTVRSLHVCDRHQFACGQSSRACR